MELTSHGLELRITPIAKPGSNDFSKISVHAEAPGFVGDYDAWVERNDFARFAAELENLDVNLKPGDTATLDTIERDFSLVLTMRAGGHIGGTYRLLSGWYDKTQPTALSGAFTLDQTYLPELRREVASILTTGADPPSL